MWGTGRCKNKLDNKQMETPMNNSMSRRTLLKGTGAVLAGAAFSTRVMAAAPAAEPVTPALVEAARKEGQVIYYTSTDLPVAADDTH